MTNQHIKNDLIHALENRGVYFRQVDDVQYVTRCPHCGDKVDNENTGHLYLRINPNDNTPILYKCFRCNFSGLLTETELKMFNIDDTTMSQNLQLLNKTSTKVDNKNIGNKQEISYTFEMPKIIPSPKTEYINNRLGLHLSPDELSELKIIPSFGDFLNLNGIKNITCKPFIARNIHDNYVGFLTSNGTHILFRDITEKQKFRWIKYEIYKSNDIGKKVFYSLPTAINILSTDEIIVNLAEGVMDIVSVAYNLGYNRENVLNACVCGKYYQNMVIYLIHLGIIGSNVTLNIFSDNDGTYDTSVNYYSKQLSEYKPLFKSINIYYNKKSKDCGVPKDKIILKKYKL